MVFNQEVSIYLYMNIANAYFDDNNKSVGRRFLYETLTAAQRFYFFIRRVWELNPNPDRDYMLD